MRAGGPSYSRLRGGISSVDLEKLKKITSPKELKELLKLNPGKLLSIALFTNIALYGDKFSEDAEHFQEIAKNYFLLHKDNPQLQNGVYTITQWFGAPVFGGAGAGKKSTAFYDITTKKYLGEVNQ